MSQLKAGAGSCMLRFPDTMFPTDGFIGVHDYPYVRILLLESKEKAAIVSMELVNVPPDAIESAQKVIAEKTGTPKSNIWVHCNHNITTPHAPRDPAIPIGPPGSKPPIKKPGGGPPNLDPEGPRKRKEFIKTLEDAVQNALNQAMSGFTEAKLGIGEGFCDVNSNRDIETPFGWWVGINRDGPSNKTATVIRVDTMDGKPIGILINYGIKPSAIDNAAMDTKTRLVCGDVTGLACAKLEEIYGAPVMFTMSAAADQVPKEQAWGDVVLEDGTIGRMDLGVEKGLEIVSRLSAEMAASMEKIIDNISSAEVADGLKSAATACMVLRKARMPMQITRHAEYEAEGDQELDAHALILGDLALVAVKPEVNMVTEQQLKKASPYAHTLMISMVNGGMKYIPDQSSYDRCTWEALSASVMPGSAEIWVNQAIAMLREVKADKKPPVVTAVGEARPDGERICKAIVEFAEEVPDVDKITAVGRKIVGRQTAGKTVTLLLDEDEDAAFVLPKIKHQGPPPGGPKPGGPRPGGPKGPGPNMQHPDKKCAPVAVSLRIPGWVCDIPSTRVSEPVIEDFTQHKYKCFPYNLYTPKNLEEGKQYPLILFIPDAGPNGNDPKLALAQGIGATVWAEPSWQEKHPCYVLALQVPQGIQLTNDEYIAAPVKDFIKEHLD